MKLLSAFLENENATVYRPAGLLVANPLSNGLLYVSLTPLFFSSYSHSAEDWCWCWAMVYTDPDLGFQEICNEQKEQPSLVGKQ